MARSTSGRGLRRFGSDPGEECIYTAECVAAAATVYLAMLDVGLTAPTAAARSESLLTAFAEQIRNQGLESYPSPTFSVKLETEGEIRVVPV